MLQRVLRNVRMRRNARRFGVRFRRCASFELPSLVRIGGSSLRLSSLAEHGTTVDFMVCFLEDEYGLSSTKGDVRTIVDIGANMGFFSLAARQYFPRATIHAYEPNSEASGHLAINGSQAGVVVFPEAVGKEDGLVFLDCSGDSNQGRTTPFGSGVPTPQVKLSTVVERLGGSIDLAKIDCEGAEWDLFEEREAWNLIKKLRLEYHLWSKRSYSDVQSALNGLNFEIIHHNPAGEWGTVWATNRRNSSRD